MRFPQPQPASPLFEALFPMFAPQSNYPAVPGVTFAAPRQPVDPLEVLLSMMTQNGGPYGGGGQAPGGSGGRADSTGRKKRNSATTGGGAPPTTVPNPYGRTFQDR